MTTTATTPAAAIAAALNAAEAAGRAARAALSVMAASVTQEGPQGPARPLTPADLPWTGDATTEEMANASAALAERLAGTPAGPEAWAAALALSSWVTEACRMRQLDAAGVAGADERAAAAPREFRPCDDCHTPISCAEGDADRCP